MSTLIIADIANDELNGAATAKVVAAVKELGDITVLCAGGSADKAANEAAGIAGVTKVLLANSPQLAHQLAEPLADLTVSLAGDYDVIAAASSANGKNVTPRIAALLDVMVVPDVSKVLSQNTFERPIYAGNAIQTVESSDSKRVITIRTASYVAAASQAPAPIVTIPCDGLGSASEWIGDQVVKSERPELTAAGRVVSGGRALGSKDNFGLIESLANKLGAAVGASRAAVDAGYVASDLQVGQTGKVVAPELYVAIGISGAIQHVAGMKDAKVIVAINKDPDAPIFQVADYGLVGDLFSIVPELIEQL